MRWVLVDFSLADEVDYVLLCESKTAVLSAAFVSSFSVEYIIGTEIEITDHITLCLTDITSLLLFFVCIHSVIQNVDIL